MMKPDCIFVLIPKNKHDDSCIEALRSIDVCLITPILPDLLVWIQDLNWPVAQKMMVVLPRFHVGLVPIIHTVFDGEDEIWKYNCLCLLEQFPSNSLQELLTDITRMAELPTEGEVSENVPDKAREVLKLIK